MQLPVASALQDGHCAASETTQEDQCSFFLTGCLLSHFWQMNSEVSQQLVATLSLWC